MLIPVGLAAAMLAYNTLQPDQPLTLTQMVRGPAHPLQSMPINCMCCLCAAKRHGRNVMISSCLNQEAFPGLGRVSRPVVPSLRFSAHRCVSSLHVVEFVALQRSSILPQHACRFLLTADSTFLSCAAGPPSVAKSFARCRRGACSAASSRTRRRCCYRSGRRSSRASTRTGSTCQRDLCCQTSAMRSPSRCGQTASTEARQSSV